MNKIFKNKKIVAVLGLGALAFFPLHLAGETRLYTVQDGETLEEISKRFLGSSEAAPELLDFNNIKNPAAVVSGSVLALPGEVRKKALLGIEAAEAAMVQCVKDGAEELAAAEFKDAKATLDGAINALRSAAYDKAQGQALIAKEKAKQVSQLANQRALTSPKAVFTKLHGRVEVRLETETDWKPAQEGQELPWKSVVRTDAQSRAMIDLPDGSSIQVLEASELNLAKYVEDVRTRTTRTRLKLKLGEVIGKIKPKRTPDSAFEIESEEAALSIRGTVLRVQLEPGETTRLMTRKGLVVAEQAGGSVEIPANFGVAMKKGEAPREAVPLLDPPVLIYPGRDLLQTARQQLLLSWRPVKAKRFSAYRLEMAADEDFQQIVQLETLEGNEAETAILAKDQYYVRIASIDTDGMLGAWSELGRLQIQPSRNIKIQEPDTVINVQGKKVVPGGTSLHLAPAESDSSVVEYEYRGANGQFESSSGVIALGGTGPVTIEARGIGLDGEKGDMQRAEYYVDASPPEARTQMVQSIKPPGGTAWERLELSASDDLGVDRIEYRIDRGETRIYDGPILLRQRRYYQIDFRAVDLVGNASPLQSVQVRGGPQYR